jgi:hypothetical protein
MDVIWLDGKTSLASGLERAETLLKAHTDPAKPLYSLATRAAELKVFVFRTARSS